MGLGYGLVREPDDSYVYKSPYKYRYVMVCMCLM